MIEYLRQLKRKSHMTNQQIAEKSNLPESTVARIFSGKTPNPTMTTVVSMTRAMGGSAADLLEKAEKDSLTDSPAPMHQDADHGREAADCAVTPSVSDSGDQDAFASEPDRSETGSSPADGTASCEKYYEEIVNLYKSELKKKDVWISRLFWCLTCMMLFILFVLVFDILHPGFGYVNY